MIIISITLSYLVFQSICDIREKKISLYASAGYTGIVFMVMAGTGQDNGGLPLSLAAAGAAFAFSLLSGGALGMGDAIVIATLALTHKPVELFLVLFVSLMLCFPVSIGMVCRQKWQRNRELPFIPFLLVGELINIAVHR